MNVALHSVSELSTHRIGISPNSAASNIRLKKKDPKRNDGSKCSGLFFRSRRDQDFFYYTLRT
jgi:hypothetical protein